MADHRDGFIQATETEIKFGNKLIAEFMGFKYPEAIGSIKDYEPESVSEGYGYLWYRDYPHTCFHDSWDWLMPVVDRIERMIEVNKVANNKIGYYYVGLGKVHLMSPEGEVMLSESPSDTLSRLERNWICCVEFIKWFNSLEHDTKRIKESN